MNDELLGYYMFSINKAIIFWVPPTRFLWTWASSALTSASQHWATVAVLATHNAGMVIPAEIWLLSSIPDLPVLAYRVVIGLLARNARDWSWFQSHFLACHLFGIMLVEVPPILELCSFTTILVLGLTIQLLLLYFSSISVTLHSNLILSTWDDLFQVEQL